MKESQGAQTQTQTEFFLKKTFNLVSRLSKLPRYWIEKVPLTAATAVRMFVICAHREWGGKKKKKKPEAKSGGTQAAEGCSVMISVL